MRAGIKTYDQKGGQHDEGENKNVTGICHGYTRERLTKVKKKKVWMLLGNIGIIRLAKTHLTTEIVSHETAHAAMWLYRKAKGNGRATFGTIEKEEDFAYILGELYECMEQKLMEAKLWR